MRDTVQDAPVGPDSEVPQVPSAGSSPVAGDVDLASASRVR